MLSIFLFFHHNILHTLYESTSTCSQLSECAHNTNTKTWEWEERKDPAQESKYPTPQWLLSDDDTPPRLVFIKPPVETRQTKRVEAWKLGPRSFVPLSPSELKASTVQLFSRSHSFSCITYCTHHLLVDKGIGRAYALPFNYVSLFLSSSSLFYFSAPSASNLSTDCLISKLKLPLATTAF